MSGVTAISHKYEANAALANRLIHFVLSARKQALFGGEPLTDLDRLDLATVVMSIRNRLIPGVAERSSVNIPEEIASHLAVLKKGVLPHFINDLEQTAQELTASGELSKQALEVLDCIIDVADASASKMFRRLRCR